MINKKNIFTFTLILFLMGTGLIDIVFAQNAISKNIKINTDVILSNANYVVYVPEAVKKESLKTVKNVKHEQIVSTSAGALYQVKGSSNDLNKLRHERGVMIEKNIEFGASTDIVVSDDELSVFQSDNPDWNLDMILDDTDTPDSGEHVKVAVMDSGVDAISGIELAGQANLVEDEQYVASYMNDMTGHGTAVASIIQSVDPDAEIYSVRVLDEGNSANLQRVVRGIYWCIENNINVINMSFGSMTRSEILEMAIDDATEAGITVVAAAGNSGENGVEYPAAYDDTIAVGSVDNNAELTDFTAVGEEVDVVAPGKEIEVETMYGMHTWVDGTSFSAPHVTAEVSRILGKDIDKDAAFVKGLVTATAKSINNDIGEGEGLIDIDEALEQYDTYAEDYTGNNIPAVSQNTEPIDTFDDEDVLLEARWTTTSHEGLFTLASNGANASLYMSEDALTAMKRGSLYPDKPKYTDNETQKVFTVFWHGQYSTNNYPDVNYIACYRYITKLALYAGDHSNFNQGVTGLSTTFFDKMNGKISASQIKGTDNEWKGWGNHFVMGDDPNDAGEYLYRGSDSRKTTLRRCFIYGMAIHQVTDSFAHSAFYSKSPDQHIEHTNIYNPDIKDADNALVCPNRFVDARAGAQRTIQVYLNYVNNNGSGIGGISGYAPALVNRGADEGYYLANVKRYAIEANGGTNTTDFNDWFDYINYPVSY